MTFSIKRKFLLGLGNWLNTLSLFGADSRERTKFVDLLAEEVKENELTRLEIIKKYATLGDENEPIVVEKDGQKSYEISDDKMPEFQKDYIEFLESDFVCGGPGLKNRLETLKKIVLNPDIKIEPSIASDYDKWCEAFESIKEDSE